LPDSAESTELELTPENDFRLRALTPVIGNNP